MLKSLRSCGCLKKRSFIFDCIWQWGSSLIVLGDRSFVEIRVAAVKRDILLWAAVAALEGGGCAGVVCRIVAVAPQAQAGLIPFTAASSPR